MVKISLETLREFSAKSIESIHISNLLDILKDEQPEIFQTLVLCGLANPDSIKGFTIAYFRIRRELEKQEIKELEKLVKP